MTYVAYTNKGTDIGIKLLPVMWVCLCIPRHPLFMKCGVMAQVHSVRYTCIQPCFLCFFSNPYMSPLNSKNFSFTCLHSFFTCFQQILRITIYAILPWVRKRRAMSCEATQCGRQRCFTNLRSLRPRSSASWTWLHGARSYKAM